MQVLHTFDAAGRETLLQWLGPTGAALAMFTSLYDAASNRTQLQELDGSVVDYSYDPVYQLLNEMRTGTHPYNTTYLNDPAGNRLQKVDSGAVTTGLFNSANELVLLTPPTGAATTSRRVPPSAPGPACALPIRSAARPEHSPGDGNGNLLVEQTGAALTSYTWSGENRLLFVDSSAGRSSYLYSADGLRQYAVEPPGSPNAGTSHFIWDQQNVSMRYEGNLTIGDRYTDYPGYWGGLASQWRSGGNSSFYGFDPQGSTRILVSIAGVVTDSYSFKAFGDELAHSGTTANPLRYEGKFGYYRDLDTRMYVRARVLDPPVGRWMSRDPILILSQRGLAYPVRWPGIPDPDGLFPCSWCKIAANTPFYQVCVTLCNTIGTGTGGGPKNPCNKKPSAPKCITKCGKWYINNWKIACHLCDIACEAALLCGQIPNKFLSNLCSWYCGQECAKITKVGQPPKWANCGNIDDSDACLTCCDKACGHDGICMDQCSTACCK